MFQQGEDLRMHPIVQTLRVLLEPDIRQSARQVTVSSYSLIPSFYYALVLLLKYLHEYDREHVVLVVVLEVGTYYL